MKVCPVCSTEYGDDVRFCKNDGSGLRGLSPAGDLVGQILAERYHVIKKLGEGGMGQVYLAEHVKMGRRSAIKVMNPSMVHDPDAVARFNREAANASRITHPHVCAIYDFGESADGLIYLAMEFIEGEPLTDLLAREGALPTPRAGRIFLQTADALQAAHDLGIVHRDLKPDNIMLARGRAGGDVVKVVDFGIAKAVGGDASQKVTKTGLVIGTPEFMSPEQLSGDPVDVRSDLYSLALVLYIMLTGKLPFEAATVQETMIKRLTDEPLLLADARPDLHFPPGLQACVDTALARAPTDRYQHVAKFASDVADVLGLAAATPDAAIPATRGDQDSKTQLLNASARVPAGRATPTLRTPVAAADAPPRARKRGRMPAVLGAVALLGVGTAAVVMFGGRRAPAAVEAGTDSAHGAFAGLPAPARSRSTPSGGTGTPPETSRPPARAAVNPARAAALLDDLFDAVTDTLRTDGTLRMARDSASHIFEAAGVGADERAFAAYVVANAFAALDDRRSACRWAEQAVRIRASVAAYGALGRALCGP